MFINTLLLLIHKILVPTPTHTQNTRPKGNRLHFRDIGTISELYRNQRLKIRCKDVLGAGFKIRNGVRQACGLPPLLFNIWIEKVTLVSLCDLPIRRKSQKSLMYEIWPWTVWNMEIRENGQKTNRGVMDIWRHGVWGRWMRMDLSSKQAVIWYLNW